VRQQLPVAHELAARQPSRAAAYASKFGRNTLPAGWKTMPVAVRKQREQLVLLCQAYMSAATAASLSRCAHDCTE
jgi:hypothetical protein